MAKLPLAQETIPPGEEKIIADLAGRLQAKIIRDNAGGIMRRDAHPKMHGLVRAEFIIEPDLPEQLKIGIFKEARSYQAWVRFSNQNGSIAPDIKRDIRGMAIKLMGVGGEKLLAQEKDAQTQDFILISTKVFVTRDVEEFDDLVKAMTGSLWSKIVFFSSHWRFLWNMFKSMRKFANPLQIRYWSTTPYLFGKTACKYSAIPCFDTPDALPKNPADGYLREAMVRRLEQGGVQFDFTVQLQTDAEAMPIEDPGQAWPESASPFRKVATIKIAQQSFDSEKQREAGENFSFNPWHCLPEHRPLGGVNRARKVVYEAISVFRHRENKVQREEPTSWEISE